MIDLRCTVRGCGKTLLPARGGQRACARGHAFNVARSGYVNLLQPQDRRSRVPGDSREAVDARRRLLDEGAGDDLLAALVETIAALALPRGARALDIGSGEGFFLAALAGRFGLEGAGVELAVRAADLAARRHPGLLWVVANADRGLPFGDRSFDLLLSIDARRNPDECARVIAPGGRLVVVVPATDDLAELRAAVLGDARGEERAGKAIAEHAGRFTPVLRREARSRRWFTAPRIADLVASTYRGGRAGRGERAAALERLEVTQAHEIVVFAPVIPGSRRSHPPRPPLPKGGEGGISG